MFDHLAIVKCIELANQADRARWQRDEDAFYRDLGHSPFERLVTLWSRLRAAVAGTTRNRPTRADGAVCDMPSICGNPLDRSRDQAA